MVEPLAPVMALVRDPQQPLKGAVKDNIGKSSLRLASLEQEILGLFVSLEPERVRHVELAQPLMGDHDDSQDALVLLLLLVEAVV